MQRPVLEITGLLIFVFITDIQMEQLLEREIESLKLQKERIELYVEQTEMWTEHIDKWRVDVCIPDVSSYWIA